MNKQATKNNNAGQKAAQMQAYKQALKRSKPFAMPVTEKKIVASLGYSSAAIGRAHQNFMATAWHELRIDPDENMQADITSQPYHLPMIADASLDGVFIGHTLHRYNFIDAEHVLKEAFRILKDEGTLIATVPDLQLASTYAANDELEAGVYQSPAGAITAIDMLFGFQRAIRTGDLARQHQSGYTMTSLGNLVRDIGFCNLKVQRQAHDLLVIGLKLPYNHPERVERIMLQTDAAPRPNVPAITASPAQQSAVRYADQLEGEPQRWKPLNLKG